MPSRRLTPSNDVSEAPDPAASSEETEAWSPDSTPFVEGYDVAEESVPVLVGVGVPAVVAVVVTRDPGPTLETTLSSIVAQEYANLTTLVIDAASAEDPTARVAAVMPTAFVKRVDSTTFAATANQALGTIEGASFFLFLHDDVELGPGSVQAMVEEAFRSNAGVVGAKLVDWDQPDRLRSVGAAIDKFGFVWPNAEVGELDQEQHDAVRECLVVSTASMLVRCDLFADVGGFSTDIDGYGEDLDFCWRARIAGGRTVVMPAARIRHLEQSEIGENADTVDGSQRLAHRHRSRIMLANYSPLHLLRVLPQAIVFGLAEMVAAAVSGRTQVAKDIASAIGWNIAHVPTTLVVRGRVKRSRRTPDHEIRRLQVNGSTRFTGFVRQQTAGNRSVTEALAAASRGLPGVRSGGEGHGPAGAIVAVVTATLLLLGSRQLITAGFPAIREFLPLGNPGALFREWWSGWRSTGFGASAGTPTLSGVAAVSTWLTLGSDGFVRTVMFLAPLPLGAVAMWRLLRAVGGVAARSMGLAVYVLNPLPYNALAEGRWQALVVYGTVPVVLGRVAHAGGWRPFDSAAGEQAAREHVSSEVAGRPSLIREVIGLGAVVAVATTVAPVMAVVTLLIAALVVGVLGLMDRAGNPRRACAVVGGGLLVSTLVHLPWVLAIVGGSNRWSVLLGADATRQQGISLSRALMFDTGAHGGPVTVGLVVAAFVALAVASEERFRWAVVSVLMILISLSAVVIAGRLGSAHATIAPELLLAVGATGASLGAGIGNEAFRRDVLGRAFGWRQIVSVLAGLAIVIAGVPFVLDVFDGRWQTPVSDVDRAMVPLEPGRVANERALWIADGDVLAKQGWSLGDGLKFTVTDGVHSSMSAMFPQGLGPGEEQLRRVVRSLVTGRGSREGEALSPFGVRYVIVLDRLAPLPYGATTFGVPSIIRDRLDQQFDVAAVEVAPGISVYENLVRRPIRYVLDARDAGGADAGPDSTTATRAPWRTVASLPTGFVGRPGTDRLIVLTTKDDGWSVEPGSGAQSGSAVSPTESGTRWASAYSVKQGAKTDLSYNPPLLMLLLHLLQVVVVIGMMVGWRSTRSRQPATDAPATDAPATDVPATDVPATDVSASDMPATPLERDVTTAPDGTDT